jgi:hypothetical protein
MRADFYVEACSTKDALFRSAETKTAGWHGQGRDAHNLFLGKFVRFIVPLLSSTTAEAVSVRELCCLRFPRRRQPRRMVWRLTIAVMDMPAKGFH